MTTSDKSRDTGIVFGNPRTAGNTRTFIDGSTRAHADLRTAAIGVGIYRPGWRWSLHAGPQVGKASENHIGYVISGRMGVEDPSGNRAEILPGCAFELPPGSDAWVIGEEPCIALDFIPKNGPSNAKHQSCEPGA